MPMIHSDWHSPEAVSHKQDACGICAACQSQDNRHSVCGTAPLSKDTTFNESQNIINTLAEKERLAWLEKAIADGSTEIWIYYQAAELAFASNQTEKAQRYLRIAMTRGWLPENSTLTHYGERSNG